jgi:chromosomal replication initiator protein
MGVLKKRAGMKVKRRTVLKGVDRSPRKPERVFSASRLDSEFTFGSFETDMSNQFARNAAIHVATNPGRLYNPLFIYGEKGLGKTHLLHAIGNSILTSNPRARVVYKTGKTLISERSKRSVQGGLACNVFLLDNFQDVCGESEYLIALMESLRSIGCQIVIAGRNAPAQVSGIDRRLLSRIQEGLVADLMTSKVRDQVRVGRQLLRRNTESKLGAAELSRGA